MMDYQQIRTDVLVIGAGLAGLEAAWAAHQAGAEVLVLSKGACASDAVLGFNAPVGLNDSPERFARDTWSGGWKLGDARLVQALSEDSVETVTHMEALGQTFDRDGSGYHLLQPLGCGVPRLLHDENVTGRKSMHILREYLRVNRIAVEDGIMAMELILQNGSVRGAVAKHTNKELPPLCVEADAVVLACGGSHLMQNSTYPLSQTADGFAMAYRAGASLVDLEFVQHEPCRCVWPKPLGISTTLLAKGGILTNQAGERFILRSYSNEGAVPKDILARLIALEIAKGKGTEHGGVWLDLTGLPAVEIMENHRLYYERFMNAGIDLTKQRVEVAPAAHSMMGGIAIDENAFTGVRGLYAAGEVTGGLHGANRLGGNAGSETYVFGRRAGSAAASAQQPLEKLEQQSIGKALACCRSGSNAKQVDYAEIKTEIRSVLSAAVGPIRDAETLETAISKLCEIDKQLQKPCGEQGIIGRQEAVNMALTGRLVCRAALERTESRGVHFRSDFPQMDDGWQRHIIWKKGQGADDYS